MTDSELVSLALEMRNKAYVPYSKFQVGAALLCKDGQVFTGCNVENGSFGATICAERTAAVSAVAAGSRKFSVIAIASSGDGFCYPCGVCRQFLSEFGTELRVLCGRADGEWIETDISALFPSAFRL